MDLQSIFLLVAIVYMIMSIMLMVAAFSLLFWTAKKIDRLEHLIMIKLEPVFNAVGSVKSFSEKLPLGPVMAGVVAAIPAIWKVIRGKRG